MTVLSRRCLLGVALVTALAMSSLVGRGQNLPSGQTFAAPPEPRPGVAQELAMKIDGSFIQNLGTQAEDELFVRTLIELAKSFGITTVGEWVGDEKTVKLLEKAGVAYMQGYFFGAPEIAKPIPAKTAV